jgi:hypothetical protein
MHFSVQHVMMHTHHLPRKVKTQDNNLSMPPERFASRLTPEKDVGHNVERRGELNPIPVAH